ncbi:hypothetical protein NQ314_019758 [Rhamnusium bicolor]|uniref:Uncharacterized protein n=1 Tax=Rhamnusium bicolor TaxID=1586634 RepID=A0AAV8WMS0_9CUCU|nr:hypothetical protein NQ314_019758 [Rhamnusium bicolor]
MGNFHETLGINELKSKNGQIWKALLAEFLGNFLLNFFGCASIITFSDKPHDLLLISLTFGLIVFTVVQALGHVSGAHLNPTVTAGMLVTSNISVIKGVLYIIVQCLGSLAGSSVLKALTPDTLQKNLGMTMIHQPLSSVQGFGMEFFLDLSEGEENVEVASSQDCQEGGDDADDIPLSEVKKITKTKTLKEKLEEAITMAMKEIDSSARS